MTEYWVGFYHGILAMFVTRLIIDVCKVVLVDD